MAANGQKRTLQGTAVDLHRNLSQKQQLFAANFEPQMVTQAVEKKSIAEQLVGHF